VRLHGLLDEPGFPEIIAVAIGPFADPNFPPPTVALWEQYRHPWISSPSDPATSVW
jgi:hypothetical protein